MKLSKLQQHYNRFFKRRPNAKYRRYKVLARSDKPKAVVRKTVLQNNSPIKFLTYFHVKLHYTPAPNTMNPKVMADCYIQGIPVLIFTNEDECTIRIHDVNHMDHPDFEKYLHTKFGQTSKLYNPEVPERIIYDGEDFYIKTNKLTDISPSTIEYENPTEEQEFQYMCTIDQYELYKTVVLIQKEIRRRQELKTLTVIQLRHILEKYVCD